MTRSILISTALLVALMSAPASAAIPQWGPSDSTSQSSAQSWQLVQRQISAREAKAIALARVPGGEVVDIRRTSDAYRVRIIARDGRVVDIVVDAATGRIR
ncbi:MAG: PepSY domain-containing protein [Litorimonas sp.]